MEQENWQQVKAIFAAALQQKPAERLQFLDRACSDDKLLRREVESLLSSLDSAENFMESPAVGELADDFLTESRKFAEGEFLGHYEIIKQIGAGGTGDVFLAQDAKLHRPVALKILRADSSPDSGARQRLLREARAAARLDHPNICAIYEISETDRCSFIVMQYVEGETLAEILARERLSARKSLDWAIQIADALEEAHSRRIVHRDIKPSNIIINRKGQLKVLDFGLAKFIEAETSAEAAKRLSSSGAIMGTVPYMSPEQLRGKRLDERTDFFSFGALFYEMLSGLAPFQKENNAESISAILNDEPDWTPIPSGLRSIVRKSLMKDKQERYQTAKDLAKDLRDARQNENFIETDGKLRNQIFPPQTAKEKTSAPRYYFWKSLNSGDGVAPRTNPITDERKATSEKSKPNYQFVFSVGFILILVGAATWFALQFSKKSDSHSFDDLRSVKLVSWKTGGSSPYSHFRVSHNGKMIAYSSTQEGDSEGIYIKQTTDGADFRVTRDEWENHTPIWSPDDQRLAFASFREGQSGIYVCPALGGQTTLLKVIGEGNVWLSYWSKDGAAIFYETKGNLFRLDLTTRETTQITDSDSSAKNYFNVSPNEDRIVYADKSGGQTDLWTMPIKGGAPVRLTNDKDAEIQPRWHPDGERILYTVYRNEHYQINLVRADGSDAPVQVTRGESEFELIDVSSDGTKIFYLSWEDKSNVWGVKIENGEEFEVAGSVEAEFWSEASPDGKSILYQSNSTSYPLMLTSASSIIIKSLTNQSPELSLKGYNPRWLPDSRRVAFIRYTETEKKYALWTVNTINGEEKQITGNSVPSPSHALLPNNRGETGDFGWSPDGKRIIYLSKESQKRNVLTTAPETGETVNLTNNENPNLYFYSPKFSPDGNLISYVSSQKPTSKDEKPLWKIWIIEDEKPKEIYSTAASLRLLGWSANAELLLEATDGAMKSSPLNVKLVKISASGDSKIITTFKNIYATSMTLSVDGKLVAFVAHQDDKDNIFTAATTGGEAKKLTANANARLYFGSPAWSPDGKTVFFDKQEETNTISMFENFK